VFTLLLIAQMVVSIALIALVMLQARTEGVGGIFGQSDAVVRTRRGVERTIFNLTVVFSALFLLISILAVYIEP